MALLTPIQIFTTQLKQITVSCYQQQRALREVLLKHHAQISFQLLHSLLCHYKLEVSQVGISLLHIHNPPSMAELAAMHAHLLHLFYLNCTLLHQNCQDHIIPLA